MKKNKFYFIIVFDNDPMVLIKKLSYFRDNSVIFLESSNR